MGAIGCNRRKGLSDREFFGPLFEAEGQRILGCASVRGTFYAALESKLGVVALVVPFKWYRSSDAGNWENYVYKTMDEGCGPNEVDCPIRLLDLLSPVEELYGDSSSAQWAAKWRSACRKRAEARAAKPAVRKGDIVEFAQPISFRGGEEISIFVFVKGATFTAKDKPWQRYKISGGWRDRDYRNLSAEARAEEKIQDRAAAFKPRAHPASRPSGLAERFAPIAAVGA